MFKRKAKVDKKALTPKARFWHEVKGYSEALIIALIVTTFFFTTVGVAGSSMEPTLEGGSGNVLEALLIGDRVFIPKYETWLKRLGIGEYKRGDIIVFREPVGKPCHPHAPGGRVFVIKRIIGLPGDHVQVFANGSVWINEQELEQSFITDHQGKLMPTQTADVTVRDKQFFVMGDNRPGSCDSRFYGTIPFLSIAGKASAVIWPPLRNSHLNWKLLKQPSAFQQLH